MNILRLSRQCVQLSLRSPRFMFSRSELLDDVESMVIKKVSEMPTVEANKVNINSHLLNDLQIDSLTQVELVVALEEMFNLNLKDEDAERIRTIQDAVTVFHSSLLEKESDQSITDQ